LVSHCTKAEWGTFELESATGKNSACEAFGQKLFSDFANLALNGLSWVPLNF